MKFRKILFLDSSEVEIIENFCDLANEICEKLTGEDCTGCPFLGMCKYQKVNVESLMEAFLEIGTEVIAEGVNE